MKWLKLVRRQYEEHGFIVEKYDVVQSASNVSGKIQFGYRSNEIGFGWTNTSFEVLYDALPEEKRRMVMGREAGRATLNKGRSTPTRNWSDDFIVSSPRDAEPLHKTRAAAAR